MKLISQKKLYVFLFILSINFVCYADNPPVKLTLILNDEMNKEDQWVYWTSHEHNFIDSCLMRKGERIMHLEGILLYEEDYINNIYFQKNGFFQSMLVLKPGDSVTVDFTKEKLALTPFTINSATQELYDYALKMRPLNICLNKFKDLQSLYPDSILLQDSIRHYLLQRSNLSIDVLKKTTNPSIFIVYIDENNLNQDSLTHVLKNRFPNSKIAQSYPQYPNEYKSPVGYKNFRERLNQISEERNRKYVISTLTIKDKTSRSTPLISLNENRINSLSLSDTKGNIISLEDISTSYILIDFWAAWCGPCRQEIPYLKKALKTNKDRLTIYAISLDNTKQQWENAILTDQSEMFTHVYGGNMTTLEGKKLCEKFGITSIPANFLLDKDRKIIATNLRGEELMMKMEELTKNDRNE